MTRRILLFVLVGAILGGIVAVVYVLNFDVAGACQTYGGGRCYISHDEIFGWQPGSLALPVWTAIGLVGGGLVGWVAAGPMTRIRWLIVGVAAVVGVVAYFAWVYTPDPGFDF